MRRATGRLSGGAGVQLVPPPRLTLPAIGGTVAAGAQRAAPLTKGNEDGERTDHRRGRRGAGRPRPRAAAPEAARPPDPPQNGRAAWREKGGQEVRHWVVGGI